MVVVLVLVAVEVVLVVLVAVDLLEGMVVFVEKSVPNHASAD